MTRPIDQDLPHSLVLTNRFVNGLGDGKRGAPAGRGRTGYRIRFSTESIRVGSGTLLKAMPPFAAFLASCIDAA